ncbi:MAG: pyridoxamine 5'-phosphate oxidase family protein [Acidimicrobiales bacterium]
MELADALSFVRGRHQGVLTTVRSSRRPQLSNIVYAVGDDAVARISVTDSRAKTKNLRPDLRASLYAVGDDFWPYVVQVFGPAQPRGADSG